MKMKLCCLLLLVSSLSMAQGPTSSTLRTRISDDQQTLSIQIDGNKAGRRIHYDESFAVSGKNELQKEVLKYRAFESQGITVPLSQIPYLLFSAASLVMAVSILIVTRFRRSRKSLDSLLTK